MKWKAKATADSFIKRYHANTVKSKTYKAAYEETENEHEQKFGERRYSSYHSFINQQRKKLTKD